MTIFNEYKTNLDTSYGSSLYLGRLCWYTVSESLSISVNDFYQAVFNKFSLVDPMPDLPPYPVASDIFKRACTNAEVRNLETDDPNIRLNWMVRQAGHDNERIHRSIVCEQVDRKGHQLGYMVVANITFNRTEKTIEFKLANGETIDNRNIATGNRQLDSVIKSVLDYYAEDKMTTYSIREFVRKYLERQVKALKVRPSGGVYFVDEAQSAAVEALDSLLNNLGIGASFHYLPLVDDSKQREMLRVAFENESNDQINTLLAEMATILKDKKKKISTNKYAQLKTEYNELKAKLQDYRGLLDEKMDGVDVRLELMGTTVTELIGRVKV